ncbi:MAG TPA: RidA family protein [Bacillota bacterium]|nr:RidA family protein [Bacillota bacterium]
MGYAKLEIDCQSVAKSKSPLSQGIMYGDLIFLSGQLGKNPDTGKLEDGIYAQTSRAMENIKQILSSVGLGMTDIIKTTIFVVDMSNVSEVNRAYSSYFTNRLPARSCVGVSELGGGAEVEVEIIAGR